MAHARPFPEARSFPEARLFPEAKSFLEDRERQALEGRRRQGAVRDGGYAAVCGRAAVAALALPWQGAALVRRRRRKAGRDLAWLLAGISAAGSVSALAVWRVGLAYAAVQIIAGTTLVLLILILALSRLR